MFTGYLNFEDFQFLGSWGAVSHLQLYQSTVRKVSFQSKKEKEDKVKNREGIICNLTAFEPNPFQGMFLYLFLEVTTVQYRTSYGSLNL